MIVTYVWLFTTLFGTIADSIGRKGLCRIGINLYLTINKILKNVFADRKMNMKNKKKENLLAIILLIVILICSAGITACRNAWSAQYKNGIYHQPFLGAVDDSGLIYQGTTDYCDIYSYNCESITYGTFTGERMQMRDVLQKEWASRERIFPIDGVTSKETINGIPVRVNKYEALVTIDMGGAMIFMHYTQDPQEAVKKLLELNK